MNPFDLPVHPAVVHFPIAFLVVAWAVRLWAYASGSTAWRERARLAEVVGAVALPFTIVAGFVDTRGFDFVFDVRWDQPLIWHVLVSLTAATLWIGHAVWEHRTPRLELASVPARVALADLGVTTLGVGLLFLTGSIAAEMVYAV